MKTSLFRWMVVAAALSLGAALLPATGAAGFPVASDAATYASCGRVFPDPHAYWPSPAQAPDESPWAKGNASCKSVDFLGWQETIDGLKFLASDEMFGDFVEVYDLSQEGGRFDEILDLANGDGKSAGLASENLGREQVPMYLVRVTDEEDTSIPINDRKHFAYALSLHGIERAGVEGGIRAVEDLATWASCEKHGDMGSAANCAQEDAGPTNPHPILETLPEESLTAGDALRQSSVWFVLGNPDGWRRGDKQEGGFFYQRYNGNGVDPNRDWPSQGFTFRPYTPWSEPETRSVGPALQDVKEKWTGGIDLHGQLIDRAFSFTLIGGSERPYDKDRRVLQFTKGAWADAEQRLSWSALIKPNDAPEDDPRVYGVQWGTIWDTIDYTVSGAMGDWMDSPIGLDADAIDNEMSLSHVANCGVGTCYIPDAEQLHVDGNKSLIYAMMHYSLEPEDTTFGYNGRAAYLYNPSRVSDPGDPDAAPPAYTALPQQEGFEVTLNHAGTGDTTHPFEVKGPDQGIYNGAIRATVTATNAQGVSPLEVNEIAIDMRRSDEENPDRGELTDDEWQTQNSYYSGGALYAPAGAQLDVNSPDKGAYRVRISGFAPAQFKVKVEFLDERAWPDPGQLPYDVSNMDFFPMLRRHVPAPTQLVRVPVDDVLDGKVDLRRFDTVVAADEAFLPGYKVPQTGVPAQEEITGSTLVGAPGAGQRSAATSGFFEFDVADVQEALDVVATSNTVADPDLYLQRQNADGTWSGDIASGESGATLRETLNFGSPTPGRYRVEVHNWAGAPGPVDLEISFTGIEEVRNTSDYTASDRNTMADIAKTFVRQGGNLVLTDNSLRAVEWMGLTGEKSIAEQKVYAGHAQFTADGGETSTYDDPLAANVDQPGAAEGEGHRHQLSEPVPTGFAIQDESGADLSTHPQWSIAREDFEAAEGRVVATVNDTGVTIGEIPVGDGVVRVLGSLLPMPTEAYDHPYGLASYAVTYSGYEVLRNLMDYTNPNGALGPPTQAACDTPQVPTGQFNDIRGNTHKGSIECIAWYGITNGKTRTRYAPSTDITRAQMATFIANLAVEGGLRLPKDPPDAFADDDGGIHESNINALSEMGLINGKSEDRYDPDGSVSRAQMATFIAAVHEAAVGELPEPAKDYFDDDDGNAHEGSVNALADLGVIQGRADRGDSDGDGNSAEVLYFPEEAVSRAQMATFVVNDLGLQVVAGAAYFGGARIALRSTNIEQGGQLDGQVVSHKRLRALEANGCGYSDDEVTPRTDGTFTIDIGQNQSSCTIAIRVTSRRVGAAGEGQAVRYRFPLTITDD